jgi:putative flippase GtrA
MMSKRDLVNATIVGAEVGIFFQPILLNLWVSDIQPKLASFGMSLPQALAQVLVLVGFTLLAPVALYVLYLLSRFLTVLYQFGKFAAVGSSNSFVDLGLVNLAKYVGFAAYIQAQFGDQGFLVLTATAAFLGTVNSFFWNKFWTFEAGKSQEKAFIEVVKFYAVTGAVAVFNGLIVTFMNNHIEHPGITDALWINISTVVAIFAGMFFNFLGYKFIVFKKPPAATPTTPAVPAGTPS